MSEVCDDDSGTYYGTVPSNAVDYLAFLKVQQSDDNPILCGRTTLKWRTTINIHDKAYYFVNERGLWEKPELTYNGLDDDSYYKYTVTARYVTGDPINLPHTAILLIRDGNEPYWFTQKVYTFPNTGYLKGGSPPSNTWIKYIEACVPPDRELPTLSGKEHNQGVYNAYTHSNAVSYLAWVELISKDINNVAKNVELYWRSTIKISDFGWSFSTVRGTWINPQLTELGYDPGDHFYKYKVTVDEIKDWDAGTLSAVLKIVDGANHTFNPMLWSNYETTNYKTVTSANQFLEGYKVGLLPPDYKKYYRVGLNMRKI